MSEQKSPFRRVLVYGGRHYANRPFLFSALSYLHATRGVAVIIHGDCPVGHGGADKLAGAWARENGVPEEKYPVDHAIDGPWPGAGPRRNRRMFLASRPDGAVEFPGWNGTKAMRAILDEAGVPVWEPCAKPISNSHR